MERLIQGDCLKVIDDLMAEGVRLDAILVDPPYEIAFLGYDWDNSGITFSADAWRKITSLLKPDGVLVSFCATRTYHRMVKAIMDAGMSYWQQDSWLYGTGMPKGLNLGKSGFTGLHTALKPAHEPIFIGGKTPRSFSTGLGRYHAKPSVKERGTSTHQTIKPLSLMEELVEAWVPEGGLVMDCFAGSGTTALAARNTGRSFIAIEQDPRYFVEMSDRLK